MSFIPAIPLSGIAGWQFLQRTEENQRATFEKGPEIARETAHFAASIAAADTVEKLMADRMLLKVALGAFGLEEDLPKKAWIRKVLEEGTESEDAFAMKLVDKRYRRFAEAMGFGNTAGARTADPGFPARIVAAYRERQFEVAVGSVNDAMRLALNFSRAVTETTTDAGPRANWFAVMGDKPLREVIDAALGIPAEAAQIDIDKQVDIYTSRAQSVLGISDPAELTDPAIAEETVRRFLVRRQIDDGPSALTPGMGALTLLQGGTGGAAGAGIANLLASLG